MSRTHRDRLNAKRKRRMVKPDWHWVTQTPSEWVRVMMTAPARREERDKITAVKKGQDDDGNWPDRKKPHIYYW
jgi:ABC-type phosphonate transport system ATPase subunit